MQTFQLTAQQQQQQFMAMMEFMNKRNNWVDSYSSFVYIKMCVYIYHILHSTFRIVVNKHFFKILVFYHSFFTPALLKIFF